MGLKLPLTEAAIILRNKSDACLAGFLVAFAIEIKLQYFVPLKKTEILVFRLRQMRYHL
jgi:hypothetical protein